MEFSNLLLLWYDTNKRDLPWRKTKDPFLIWLSEIILQQTRVEQGLEYYNRFSEKFPTVQKLAAAQESQILKEWQGLGYYSRARNMHFAANEIMQKYGGKFPDKYEDILSLKGIGTYSAAAIGSFAYGLPYPVVDGNVYRLLSRVFGIKDPIDSTKGKKIFFELANELKSEENIAEYNQAIMEFGALQCIPVKPDCENCILKTKCVAFNDGIVKELPHKKKKIKQRNRYFHYFVIRWNNHVLLRKRVKNDIWKNMYDFPSLESEEKLSQDEVISSDVWNRLFENSVFTIQKVSPLMKHLLSHQKVYAQFWEIKLGESLSFDNEDYTMIKNRDLEAYPLPKLIENYLDSKN